MAAAEYRWQRLNRSPGLLCPGRAGPITSVRANGFARLIGTTRLLRGVLGLLTAVAVVVVAALDSVAGVDAVTVLLFVVVPVFGLLAAYTVIIVRLVMPASRIWTAPDRSTSSPPAAPVRALCARPSSPPGQSSTTAPARSWPSCCTKSTAISS